MPVVVVTPDGEPPSEGWPGVVILHEILGMQPEILAVADRFAERGWAAIVPNYFFTGTRVGCIIRTAREIRSGKPGRATGMVVAAARHLGERPDVAADRIAAIGFCIGGGLALLLGTVGDSGIKAVAANYADVPTETTLRTSPPVVASYGARDKVVGRNAEVLRKRLDSCHVVNDVKLYPNAGHAFMTEGHHPIAAALAGPMRVGYVADAAEDAWRRVFTWLDRYVLGANGHESGD